MEFAKFLLDPKTYCPSPNEIQKMAISCVRARSCLETWEQGKLTREEALGAALYCAIEDLKNAKQKLHKWCEDRERLGNAFTETSVDMSKESPQLPSQ
jgi:hypothetical protein